jgi:RND superfamily putative drug exporter
VVWIFQDGHLGALGATATGTLAVTMPALLFCIAFGLLMDYEVMLGRGSVRPAHSAH